MSKIKKDIKKDINPESVTTHKKDNLKDILWVLKSVVLFVLLQFLGQVLYAVCFALSIPEARQNIEIFQNILYSPTVINQAYYFGHLFIVLCIITRALMKAKSNNKLGATTIDKFLDEIDWKPIKNAFHGINYFAVGLTMQSVSTTLISIFALLVLGRELSGIEAFFSISSWSIFIVGLVMPIAEELLFRGAMLNRLTKKFGEKRANQIQALAYALIHGLTAYTIADIVMGLMFGKLKKQSGSIIAPLLAHIGANALNALIYTFPELLLYRGFSIVYSIVLIYGAGILLYKLFKSVWDRTKQ